MANDDLIARAEALAERLNEKYADDPNIIGVGWGLARRGGKHVDGVAIVFHVNKKHASKRAVEGAGSAYIPDTIEGFPTDIVESKLRPSQMGSRDETKYDPLRGGPATSNSEEHIVWFNGYGTLGVLGRDNNDNSPIGLSNWHVWADGGDQGDQIIQPAHPTAGDHIEAITKVAACGPLLTSLIEWEAPGPITLGLYGGAAAAAVAAALSDYKDPSRRGQENTPTDPGELTEVERVDASIEYPQLPLPGRPFKTKVEWTYTRETDARVLTHDVKEDRVNAQFLLGKLVTTDKTSYLPGESIQLTAAIWDYQPRPCDAYHVVAHLIPHNRPAEALRVSLQPVTCPRTIPPWPPRPDVDPTTVCVVFDEHDEGGYPYKGHFEWLSYVDPMQNGVRIVDWLGGTKALVIPYDGLNVSHSPASRVTARVAQFTNQPVTMTALGEGGAPVGQVTAPSVQGAVHDLSISAEGVTGARFTGGGGEGLLVRYCIDAVQEQEIATPVTSEVAAGLGVEFPGTGIENSSLKANRCCFTGRATVPPNESAGKWDVHLTVQNVNTVPDGTTPEDAATQIGGHLLSSHTAPNLAGCLAVTLLDHAFDVI